ncbi:hypothetical protein A2U01_0103345, partial [Trifolium medium]|nr:hypothetical protein [Trifolium medium]
RRKQTANSKTGAEGCALRPRVLRLAPQTTRILQLFVAYSILLAIEPPP